MHTHLPRRAGIMLKAGFTLIELAIVLVIIGLVVGGVMVGKDMIYSTAIRSQISDFEKIETAVLTFKLKYGALPGDVSNASNFFAGSSSGNGNGMVDSGDGYSNSFGYSGNPWMERCQFWYHLSTAGLISETYDICTANSPVSGNSPMFKGAITANTFNWIVTAPCATDNCPYTNGYHGGYRNEHYIISQSPYNGSSMYWMYMGNNHAQRPAPFTVEDVRSFDQKMDDGNALTGKFGVALSVNPFNYYAASITDLCTDAATTDKYKANYTSRQCHFWLKTSF